MVLRVLQDLLDAAYEVSSEHVVLSSRVVDLLDQLQQVSSSTRPWDQSQLARLQNDALLAMKQQGATELHQADLVQDMSNPPSGRSKRFSTKR
eukprot:s230_g20.t1